MWGEWTGVEEELLVGKYMEVLKGKPETDIENKEGGGGGESGCNL